MLNMLHSRRKQSGTLYTIEEEGGPDVLLGSYYYAWYKDRWLSRTIRKNDPPLLGEYDNTVSGDVVRQQILDIKSAGIDFVSISWSPGDSHQHVMNAASEHGVKVTFLYESLQHELKGVVTEAALPLILADMRVIKQAMQQDCWLKINGRPVLMIYVTRAYRGNVDNIFRRVRNALGDVFIVADQLFWEPLPYETAIRYDALTAYNMYQTKRFSAASPEETCESYLASSLKQMKYYAKMCSDYGIPLWGNAMPGYDDSGVRPDRQHPPIPRQEGDFFKRSLADALGVSNARQALMVTSWNEVYEDSQIEPCISYGDRYLKILAEFKRDKM
jgi:hypothetical protein